jgi:hypothetical protein
MTPPGFRSYSAREGWIVSKKKTKAKDLVMLREVSIVDSGQRCRRGARAGDPGSAKDAKG